MSMQLAQGLRALTGSLVIALTVCTLSEITGRAHVILDSPNGGESLTGGATISVDWHIDIEHNTLNWDVFYSIASDDGPWLPIVEDFPIDDRSAGTPYSFDWNVPSINASTAWVRVIQDNAGMDWDDVSDASFSIASTVGGGDFTGDGSVNADDLMAWTEGFGAQTAAASTDGDADLDADVDGMDFLTWQFDYDGVPANSAVTSVPEPAATVMLLVGMLLLLWKRP